MFDDWRQSLGQGGNDSVGGFGAAPDADFSGQSGWYDEAEQCPAAAGQGDAILTNDEFDRHYSTGNKVTFSQAPLRTQAYVILDLQRTAQRLDNAKGRRWQKYRAALQGFFERLETLTMPHTLVREIFAEMRPRPLEFKQVDYIGLLGFDIGTFKSGSIFCYGVPIQGTQERCILTWDIGPSETKVPLHPTDD